MINLVLTGGVGCGKSAACEHLLRFLPHTVLFSSDAEVHRRMEERETAEAIRKRFGNEALDTRGVINRAWLRKHVFCDLAAKKALEGILHPLVLMALEGSRRQALSAGAKVFVAEVPLHYEIGGTVSSDLVIVVAASPSVQVRRLMDRRGLDESTINQLLRAQWPIEAKVEKADVAIWNDGDEDALETQVRLLARKLSQG